MAEVVDLFVIGGGSGGVACARRAASHGGKVALAEAGRVGGTCVIRGCVPKKLMHYAAHFADHFEAADGYGWRREPGRHDWDALIAARDREIERLSGIYIRLLEESGVRLIKGRARLLEPQQGHFIVEVDGQRHHARRVLIAVGARPRLVDIPGIDQVITSDQVLEGGLARPERVAVIGAGYIGLELATILAGLGVETTQIFRADLPLRGFDLDVRIALADAILKRGVRLMPGTAVRQIVKSDRNRGLVLDTGKETLEVDAVIYATGRGPRPNTMALGLEALGVDTTGTGAIKVDHNFQSNVIGIHALGDCADHGGHGMDSGSHDLTPVAIAEGRALAERLFNDNPQPVAYDSIPTAVFSLPQAAAVGLTEERARAKGFDVVLYRTRFKPMLHTLTGQDVQVMMKLVVDRDSDRVLGCHMVGDEAAEIVQGLAVALTAGATKAQFDATVGLHPTAAEEFVTMFQPVG